nr:Putative methyltransferase [uncultured bacterium]
MYSRPQLLLKYLQYYFTASNGKGHGMHSPFVFEFITTVLNDKTVYPEYEKVEALRNQLLNDNTVLEVEDFGAGSVIDKKSKRSISSITKNAAKPKKFGQLLFRMIKHYQPKTILELGTSLGITTSYLSPAKPDARLITMEGSKEIIGVAKRNLRNLEIGNVEVIEGNFDMISHYHLPSLNYHPSTSHLLMAIIEKNQLKDILKSFCLKQITIQFLFLMIFTGAVKWRLHGKQ